MNDITIIGSFSNNSHNDSEDGSLMLCIPQLNSEYDNFYKIWIKYIKANVSHEYDNSDESRSNDYDYDNNNNNHDGENNITNYHYNNGNYVDDDGNNVVDDDDDDDKVKYKNFYERNEYLSCSIWLNDQKPITKGFKLSTTFFCSWEEDNNNIHNKNMNMMKEKLYKTCKLFQQHDNNNNKDNFNSFDSNKRKSKTRFSSDYNNSSSRNIDFLPANSNVVLLGKYYYS
jgi:hypothetical protein